MGYNPPSDTEIAAVCENMIGGLQRLAVSLAHYGGLTLPIVNAMRREHLLRELTEDEFGRE